jgi:methylmalonyl-CoA/ethylmalonyl-CoA epimerase
MIDLNFHHIGVACDSIEEVASFLENTFSIINKTPVFELKHQNVDVCLLTTSDNINIELVSGVAVENLVKKKKFLYHNCWEVEDIDLAINHFVDNGAMLISEPKPSELFNNRKVAFLLTMIGIVELLERDSDGSRD